MQYAIWGMACSCASVFSEGAVSSDALQILSLRLCCALYVCVGGFEWVCERQHLVSFYQTCTYTVKLKPDAIKTEFVTLPIAQDIRGWTFYKAKSVMVYVFLFFLSFLFYLLVCSVLTLLSVLTERLPFACSPVSRLTPPARETVVRLTAPHFSISWSEPHLRIRWGPLHKMRPTQSAWSACREGRACSYPYCSAYRSGTLKVFLSVLFVIF